MISLAKLINNSYAMTIGSLDLNDSASMTYQYFDKNKIHTVTIDKVDDAILRKATSIFILVNDQVRTHFYNSMIHGWTV